MSTELKVKEHPNDPISNDSIAVDQKPNEQTSIDEARKLEISPNSESPLQVEKSPATSTSPKNIGGEKHLLTKEAENTKAFAFDINYKIDELQNHIEVLAGGFNKSKGDLANALGDLQSRTASITGEIESISSLIERSDHSKKELIRGLEGRLKNAVNTLSEELGGVESHVQSQHDSLARLQTDLDKSYKLLNDKLKQFKEATDKKFDALDLENELQTKTQQVFSDYLDELKTNTNVTADEVYRLGTDAVEHKRVTRNNFMVTAGSIAAVALLFGGILSYQHYTESPKQQNIVHQLTEQSEQLNALARDNTASAHKMTILETGVKNVDAQISTLDAQMNRQFNHLQQELAAVQTTAEDSQEVSVASLLEKIAALELSLYGPSEHSTTLPKPILTVHDQQWIAQQDSAHYAIQLVGVYRERSIVTFANQHATDLSDHPLSFNVSEYRGQNWHNLYYGNFASFSEAQSVLDSLPANIQRNSPWIRRFDSVQKSAVTGL